MSPEDSNGLVHPSRLQQGPDASIREDSRTNLVAALNAIILAILFAVPAFAADATLRPALSWSKTFGGSGTDGAIAVATDAAGNSYIAGYTTSPDFPVQNGVQMHMGGTPLHASANGGKSWTTPAIPPGVTSIAGYAVLYAFTAMGIYKSADSGKTWTTLTSPPLGPMGSVLVDPTNPSTLYVATQSGIWKAIDQGAGSSWSQLLSLSQTNSAPAVLFPDPARPSTIFASLNFSPYRSTDDGATWTELTNMPYQTISIAVDAVNPNTVYSAVWTIGVFRSLDGGDTWTKTAAQPVTYSPNAIAASPTALYLATSNGVMRSTDGGTSWSPTTITAPADVVAIDPNNPKTVYAAAGQVYVSTDDGSTWTPLLTVPLHSVATIAPTSAGLFIGSVLPQNIFVTKWNASGSQMLWSTYLGGSYYDFANAIAVDAAGNVYVTGFTDSSDFPTTAGTLQSKLAGPNNAFVSKISADGSNILYSTLLGGSGGDSANAIAIDRAGDAYITGYTGSADFPVTPNVVLRAAPTPSQGCARGGSGGDAFVSKLAPNGDALLYSTYLGGACADIGFGIAVDSSGSAYIAGATYSPDFPGTTNPAVYAGRANVGFLAKLTPPGDALAYAIFLGSGVGDVAQSVAVDRQGDVYVTGSSFGLDAPQQPHPGSLVYNDVGSPVGLASGGPAFVAKFGSSGARIYATYLGVCFDTGTAIAPNSDGTLWVAGATGMSPGYSSFIGDSLSSICSSGNVPTVHPFQALQLGWGFVSELSSDGSSVLFSSLLDGEYSLAADASGNAFISGYTLANDKWSPMLWKIDGSVPSPVTIEAPQGKAMSPHLYGLFQSAVVAPGAVLVIPGMGLGPGQQLGSQITPAGTLATTLGGASVTFDGILAPLVSVQAQQIVCLAPFELAGRTTTAVQVAVNGALSNSIRVPVTPTASAILAVVNQDGTLNSQDHTAAPGSVITMYLSGLGPSDPPVPDGTINSPGSPLPKAPIDVEINWWLAPDILYLGPAPGQPAGIVQINFQIPLTIPGIGAWPAPPYDQYSLVAGTGDTFTGDHDVAPLWIE